MRERENERRGEGGGKLNDLYSYHRRNRASPCPRPSPLSHKAASQRRRKVQHLSRTKSPGKPSQLFSLASRPAVQRFHSLTETRTLTRASPRQAVSRGWLHSGFWDFPISISRGEWMGIGKMLLVVQLDGTGEEVPRRRCISPAS